jgi:hypothetical protein|tara:strand:+ start:972 stop:1385 length:414 start_codon:yes stop_codon:yes gene_type:complete
MEPTKPEIGDIRLEWDWVKKGVKEILAEQPQLTFRAEDVYAECLHGNAVLWTTKEGFIVSQTSTDPFTNENTFLVWLAWAKNKGNQNVVKYTPFFNEVAKNAGYKFLKVKSPIEAISKYLLNEGWNIDTITYRKEVK